MPKTTPKDKKWRRNGPGKYDPRTPRYLWFSKDGPAMRGTTAQGEVVYVPLRKKL